MEHSLGMAALTGVIAGSMLAAWMLGRWQGGLRAAVDEDATMATGATRAPSEEAAVHGHEAGPRSCQQAAQAERRAVLEGASALADLHADISAYRDSQRVLSNTAATAEIRLSWSPAGSGHAPCRYLGVSGQPTCPSPEARCSPDTCKLARPGSVAVPPQPSAEPVVFTRV